MVEKTPRTTLVLKGKRRKIFEEKKKILMGKKEGRLATLEDGTEGYVEIACLEHHEEGEC